MSTTLANINTLVNDRRRDDTANSIDMTGDGFRAVNGALQIWDQQHNWPWQIFKTEIQYNEGITTYNIDSSLAFKALIDLRPSRGTENSNEFYYVSNNKFDSDSIRTNRFAIKTESQNQYLRLNYTGEQATLNASSSLDSNGTWVGATAISNVATDSYEHFSQGASVKWDYSGTTGTLTNSDMSSTDVSRYAQRSTVYFDVYLQSVTNFTSFTLKVGSSSSAYITGSITTDYLGNTLVVGWNRCKLVWDGTTTVVGTLDNTAWNYIQVTVAYSGNPSTSSNRIENFFISENIPITLEYYSHFMSNDISASADVQVFNDSAATGDLALWSGEWDYVNEAFVNSVMEIITWMTGESSDRNTSVERIRALVDPLKSRMPSKRRYPEMSLVADINL